MKESLLEGLRCPACHGALSLSNEERSGGLVLHGELACQSCRRVYPIREGAAYLAVLDEAWGTILKELINRREIIEENIRTPKQAGEEDQRKADQDRTVSELADICFREAADRIPEDRPLRLIDCGAGMFETTAWFAERGIDAVGTETEISMIRYANFQSEGRGDPQEFELNNRPYSVRDPKGYPAYFSRVVSDIQRLPFRSGFFDAAFCRAMLHHVDRVGSAITEMARLVRPGGLIILCAEPARSILDRESEHHVGTVDREEGMNEQAPTLLAYRRPLARLSSSVAIQYWPFEQVGRSRRILSRVPYNYLKHLWPGEVLAGWKWRKLLPVTAGVNIYAVRDKREAASPPRETSDAGSAGTLFDVYAAFDENKTLESLRYGTEELKRLRRRILARNPERFPASVEPGHDLGMLLEAGWGPAGGGEGRDYRYILKRASIILRRPPGAKQLHIEYSGVPGKPESPFLVKLNGETAGSFSAQEKEWRTEELNLPDKEPIVQVELLSSEPAVLEGADFRVGAAIRRLELV